MGSRDASLVREPHARPSLGRKADYKRCAAPFARGTSFVNRSRVGDRSRWLEAMTFPPAALVQETSGEFRTSDLPARLRCAAPNHLGRRCNSELGQKGVLPRWISLRIFAFVLCAACSSGPEGGHVDQTNLTDECTGASRDEGGYCRTQDGRFAKSSCCGSVEWECSDLQNWAVDHCGAGGGGTVDWDGCLRMRP